MRETEAEVLARIDATRARMGDTIEEIGDRVNPDRVRAELKARARNEAREVKENVKNRARSAMRDIEHEVSDAGRGIWDTVRENPFPAGMVGVGLAWLLANGAMSGRHGRSERSEPSLGYAGMDAERGYQEPQEPHAESLKERASGAKDRAREKVEDVVERVQDSAEHAMHATRERTSELAHRAGEMTRDAGHRARRAERRVEDAVQENPLAAGAIAAALGFAAGMMIPESDREREMFGPTRDRFVDRAERTVRRAGEKAKDVARETAGDAAKAAMDEVMHAGDRGGREAVSEPGR